MVKKGNACWIVSSSKVALSAPIQTGSFGDVTLPEDAPPAGSKRSIAAALGSPEKSSVKGKIIKVSPISFRMDGTLPVRCLAVKDETAIVKVALFDKLATNTYAEGSSVELTAVYQKTFDKRQQLTASRETSCQFITSQTLRDLPVHEDDLAVLNDDPDFKVWPIEEEELYLEIDSIFEAFSYQCCPQMACRQKKLVGGKCPTCSGSSSRWTYRANVTIIKQNSDQVQLTLFSKDLNLLFGIIDQYSDDELIDHLVQQLPKKFKGKIAKKCLFNISV